MNERILRELELDVVARLYARAPTADAPPKSMRESLAPAQRTPPPVLAPRAPRALLADAMRPGLPPWLVVGWPEALEGPAGRLLDAMLAAVGRQRRVEIAGSQASPDARLVLILGDCGHESPLDAVPLPDPRHLLDHPAGKSGAWESLVRARRLAGG